MKQLVEYLISQIDRKINNYFDNQPPVLSHFSHKKLQLIPSFSFSIVGSCCFSLLYVTENLSLTLYLRILGSCLLLVA